MRDTQEAQTVAAAIDHICQGHLRQAMNVLTMRLVALIRARARGGGWEVAQRGEPIAMPGAEVGPADMANPLA